MGFVVVIICYLFLFVNFLVFELWLVVCVCVCLSCFMCWWLCCVVGCCIGGVMVLCWYCRNCIVCWMVCCGVVGVCLIVEGVIWWVGWFWKVVWFCWMSVYLLVGGVIGFEWENFGLGFLCDVLYLYSYGCWMGLLLLVRLYFEKVDDIEIFFFYVLLD